MTLSFVSQSQEIVFPTDGLTQLADNVGGKLEFKRIFEQEVCYPPECLKMNIKGEVTFKFIVTKEGKVDELKKVQSVNKEIDAEALRIFKLLEFIPSKYHGEPVNSNLELTFRFNPGSYKRIVRKRGYEKVLYPEKYLADTSLKIYSKVDELPVYPQGNYALSDFIHKNLVYPQVAAIQKIKGKVVLSFIVEPSGYPTNIMVTEYLGFGCDEEAVRVMSLVKWKPASLNGKLTRYRMSFPLEFNLNDAFKDNSLGEQKY